MKMQLQRWRSVRSPASVKHANAAVVWLRLVTSLAWLESALYGKDAKLAPSFFDGSGLAERVTTTFVHTAVSPAIADLLRTVVAPNAHLFAVMLGIGDLAIGISLALGLFTKLGAAGEIVRAVTNLLVAGASGADTQGFNVLLILAGVIAIVTCSGRRFGIDAWLVSRYPSARALRVVS